MQKALLLLVCFANACFLYGGESNSFKVTQPSAFAENKGQVIDINNQPVPDVLAKVSTPLLDVYFTTTGLTYVVKEYIEDDEASPHPVFVTEKKTRINYSRADIALSNARISKPQFVFEEQAAWKTNHYNQAVPKGVLGLSHFQKMTIQDVYPFIDWVWSVTPEGNLKYDFVVRPGGNPADITMIYSMADLSVQENYLHVITHRGTVIEGPLKAFDAHGSPEISYLLKADRKEITFEVGKYDNTKDLVIDPPLALQWSDLYGGSFSDGLRSVANDSGLIYLTGYTMSTNFPTRNVGGNAYFDSTYNGSSDALILRLDSGRALQYGTYLGGGGNDYGNSISVYAGNTYVTGGAQSGFPVLQSGNGYFQGTATGMDAFLCRFDRNLEMVASTFYGAAGNEEGMKVAAGANFIHVAGFTNSPSGTFPTLGLGPNSSSGVEAFWAVFNTGFIMIYSQLYGGSGDDYATSLAVEGNDYRRFMICGFSSSPNLPTSAPQTGVYSQTVLRGSIDGFIVRVSNLAIARSTYFGGNQSDYLTDISYSPLGSYFLTGRTNSINFPLLAPLGLGYYQNLLAGSYDAVLMRILPSFELKWSTYYGGSGNDGGTGIAIDASGQHMFTTGFTFSNDFPIRDPGYGYFQGLNAGSSDGYVGHFSFGGVRNWVTYKGDTCYQYPADISCDDVFSRFYVCGEGFAGCNRSIPDTGIPNNGGMGQDGFVWAFGGGDAGGGFGVDGFGNPCGIVISTRLVYPACSNTCAGVVAAAVSGGTSPYQFLWSNGETGDTAYNYCPGESFLQVIDDMGCIGEVVFALSDMTVSVQDVTTDPCSTFRLYSASTSGGIAPITYQWSSGDYYSPVYLEVSNTPYTVTASDQMGCTATAVIYNTDLPNYLGDVQIVVVSPPTCGLNNGIVASVYLPSDSAVTAIWEVYDSSNVFLYQITTDTLYNVGYDMMLVLTDHFNCIDGNEESVWGIIASLNPPRATIISPSSCLSNDGSILIAQDGALNTGNLQFEWSNGATGNVLQNLSPGIYELTITDDFGCFFISAHTIPGFDSVYIDFNGRTLDSVSCFNQATAQFMLPTISGGSAPYNYLWSTGETTASINNLGPGQYGFTVTDQYECSASEDSLIVYVAEASNLDIDSAQAECLGSSGTLSVNIVNDFGLPPYNYTYAWSTGSNSNFTQVPGTGTYIVTVTANNGSHQTACIVFDTLPNHLTVSIDNIINPCDVGSYAEANVVGGLAPYLFEWSNGVTGNINTTPLNDNVTVLATDGMGCIADATAYVDIVEGFSSSYNMLSLPCHNGNATIEIEASGGYTPYTGVGVFTPSPGNYVYQITDSAGCTISLNVVIANPTPIVVSYNSTPIACNGDSTTITVFATGGTPPYSGTGNHYRPAGTYIFQVTDSLGCLEQAQVSLTEPAEVSATYALVPVSCFGDTAEVTISASGGISPYSGTGTIHLPAGNYQQMVSDSNGCSTTLAVSIVEPQPLSGNFSANPITCTGLTTEVTIFATGGTSPYFGTDTLTLQAGSYAYHISDVNGCNDSVYVIISEPAPLTTTYSYTPILCSGSQSNLTITSLGGTPPYNGTGTFNISAGNHTYLVSDVNGCADTISFAVTSPPVLNSNALLVGELTCLTDTAIIEVTANGGTPPYSGTGVFTVTTDSVVNYLISDANGCPSYSSIHIDLINDSVVSHVTIDTVCLFNNVILGVGQMIDPIWHPGGILGNDYYINGIVNDTLVYASGTGLDGCRVVETFDVRVEDCAATDLENVQADYTFDMYPNPASDAVSIRVDKTMIGKTLTIVDVTGRIVFLTRVTTNYHLLHTNSFTSGVYLVTISTPTEGRATKKLVISR